MSHPQEHVTGRAAPSPSTGEVRLRDVAGYIASFERSGDREVSYWFGRTYRGSGIATRARRAFLEHVSARPLYARANENLFIAPGKSPTMDGPGG